MIKAKQIETEANMFSVHAQTMSFKSFDCLAVVALGSFEVGSFEAVALLVLFLLEDDSGGADETDL